MERDQASKGDAESVQDIIIDGSHNNDRCARRGETTHLYHFPRRLPLIFSLNCLRSEA